MARKRMTTPGDLVSFKQRLVGSALYVDVDGRWLVNRLSQQAFPMLGLIVSAELNHTTGQAVCLISAHGVFFLYTKNGDELICRG
jgi:hypothetical protein